MSARSGLTLIELLVSIMLGMVLLTMGTTALMHISKIAKRDVAQRRAHDDVAMIDRHLQLRFSALYPGSSIRIEADPGADGGWGTGDEVISLFWMSQLRDLSERTLNYDELFPRALVWNKLEWEGDGQGGGVIRHGVSFPGQSSSWNGITFTNRPQWRRDRTRDLDDNDGRWVAGMRGDILEAISLNGDREGVEGNMVPIIPPSTKVPEFVLEWIDAAGSVIRADRHGGVTVDGVTPPRLVSIDDHVYSGAHGSSDPHPGRVVYVIDGTYVDGRDQELDDGNHRIAAQRPAVIRCWVMLVPVTNTGLAIDDEPHLPFSLSFSVNPQLPVL